MLSILGMSTQAATVPMTLTVDHADRVSVNTTDQQYGILEIPRVISVEDGNNSISPTVSQPLVIRTSSLDYVLTSVTLNGAPQDLTDDDHTCSIIINSEHSGGTIVIETAEASTSPGTDPSDPGNEDPVSNTCRVTFSFYTGGGFGSTFNTCAIADGANPLVINDNVATSLVIKPADAACTIESITVDGTPVAVGEVQTEVAIADGTVIDITSSVVTRDAVCTFTIDNPSKWGNIKVTRGSEQISLSGNSQDVEFFSDSESTFSVAPASAWGANPIVAVIHNGKMVNSAGYPVKYTIYGVKDGDEIAIYTQAAQEATISAGGLTTFCPVTMDVTIPYGVTAYTVDLVGDYAKLTPVDGNLLPQGCGVVLEGEAGQTYSFNPAAGAEELSGNRMVGVTEPTMIGSKYVLVYKDGECFFGKWSNTTEFPAGKAYLNMPASGAPLKIVKEGTTGVQTLIMEIDAEGNIYNAAGQKVGSDYKGFVIKDGRKEIRF